MVVFTSLFACFAILERFIPARQATIDWRIRWLNNLGLSFFNSAIVRLVNPFSGTVFAVLVEQNNWGLLNLTNLPVLISIPLFLLVFDLTIYFQHRVFHYFQILWVLHRVHHADPDYDLTTGTRFHPLSILISMSIKLVLVLLLGAPALAILVAEILLNATSMFNHSNIKLSEKLDRRLRNVIVTPDMHRIHRSTDEQEQGCNFGFNFSCWDKLFGTYLEAPKQSQAEMSLGIEGINGSDATRIDGLLLQPFLRVNHSR